MLRRRPCVVACSPLVNDYVKIADGKCCPQAHRLKLKCGNCGPNWGDLKNCEDQCNALKDCTHITYFDDRGCRVYSACNLTADNEQVSTQVYKRNDPSVVPVPTPPPPGPVTGNQNMSTQCHNLYNTQIHKHNCNQRIPKP